MAEGFGVFRGIGYCGAGGSGVGVLSSSEDVLKHCEGEPTFVVDRAPWLRGALEEMGLRYGVEPFRR